MMVKIFHYYHYDHDTEIEKEINDFVKDKEVIDIKQSSALEREKYHNEYNVFTQILIMYKEETK